MTMAIRMHVSRPVWLRARPSRGRSGTLRVALSAVCLAWLPGQVGAQFALQLERAESGGVAAEVRPDPPPGRPIGPSPDGRGSPRVIVREAGRGGASVPAVRTDPEAAEALYRTDQRAAALAAFQQLVEQDPGHAHGWLRLGNLHQLRGDIAAAARAYRRAADLPPRQPDDAAVRGKALLNLAMLGLIRARQALAEFEADGLAPAHMPAWEEARRRLTRFEGELDRASATGAAAVGGQGATPSVSAPMPPDPSGDSPIEIRVLPTVPDRPPSLDAHRPGKGRAAGGERTSVRSAPAAAASISAVSSVAGRSGSADPPQVIVGRPAPAAVAVTPRAPVGSAPSSRTGRDRRAESPASEPPEPGGDERVRIEYLDESRSR